MPYYLKPKRYESLIRNTLYCYSLVKRGLIIVQADEIEGISPVFQEAYKIITGNYERGCIIIGVEG